MIWGLMVLSKPTHSNPLLLNRLFGFVGSAGTVLLVIERDAELILTTGSMMGCSPITVLGFEIEMCHKLLLVAVLAISWDTELCLANGFWTGS